MAEWYRPQPASLVDVPPADGQWLHEVRFDGYRAGCRMADGQVTLTSRNSTEWTPDGMVRHPTCHGLTTDRPPAGIEREESGARSRQG